MNISDHFIRRPIGTTLLALGLFLLGIVAYQFLPVASMPTVDFPTITVGANRPGADPQTMAATVAAPLERRLGQIADVLEMTSRSSLGSMRISVQFDVNRNIDGAARDVQAAINAALADLPSDLQSTPSFRKANPSSAPILILALTSKSIAPSAIYDAADTVVAQRLSQVPGVAQVSVNGAEQPAIRVRVNPVALASMGLSMEEVRTAIANTNAQGPLGALDGAGGTITLGINDQLRAASQYDPIVVRTHKGAEVRLSAVASIQAGLRDSRYAGWYNRQPSVLLVVTKEAKANIIETVDRINQLLPDIRRSIPAGIEIAVLSDRTGTIRAGVRDMQLTLAATIVLVILVVWLFLRRLAATLAACVTIPLSLAGTCAAMWLAGFSIDNLSLMALAVSVGFVVDDAIVMIEACFRNREIGLSARAAAAEGARQVGFTIVAISISLLAAFIPLLFMHGVPGRIFREFSVTLAFAVAISMLISLSVTPMICARMTAEASGSHKSGLERATQHVLLAITEFYRRTLRLVLQRQTIMLIVLAITVGLTGFLYFKAPKGYFPKDDTGLIFGLTQASADISFRSIHDLQQQAANVVLSDPAVAGVGSSVGTSAWTGSVNEGLLFISLKPLAVRGISSEGVINRLRPRLNSIPGLSVYMASMQDVSAGAGTNGSAYQLTLWDPNDQELLTWVPRVLDTIKATPGLTDVTSDRQQTGLQANVAIDRIASARLGVRIQDVDTALNDSFGQRQISTLYTERNQYRVILEVDPRYQRDPSDLGRIYVSGAHGKQTPLSAVSAIERGTQPLRVNHEGQFPALTIGFNLADGGTIGAALSALNRAIAELHLPDTLHVDFAGDAKAYQQSLVAEPLLILAALVIIYIILGVLYESLAHPLTIISTLPSAGLGALLALQLSQTELSLVAFVGIVLLIGIVMKNGIMMVDFALDAERSRSLMPEQAIFEACLARFRPILMTTMAALLGALPLVIATGPGSELRRPLGITIVGGLLVSQVLTLYITPVVYLLLDRLQARFGLTRKLERGLKRL